MSQSKRASLSSYQFSASDRLFLDTNVWLAVLGPHAPGDELARIYSRALADIRQARCAIFVDSLVLAEFINRCVRIAFETFCPNCATPGKFKEFRRSPLFAQAAADIANDAGRILEYCGRLDHCFAALDIDPLLAAFGAGRCDFNDLVITELCKREGLTLVTHDGDFSRATVPLISANPKLL